MPANVTIRKAQKRDRGELIPLCIELFGENLDPVNRPLVANYPEIITRMWAKVNFQKSTIFIAEQGATIVGYVKGHLLNSDAMVSYKTVALVEEFVVHQRFRRQGIGRALLAAFENYVSPETDRVILSTDAHVTAKSFYEKVGYHASAYRMLKVIR